MSCVPSADPETKIWVQVDFLESDSRKQRICEEVTKERREGKERCISG